MSDQVATPESIREFRDRWELSQPKLAQAMGLAPQTVSRWERGVQVIANPRLIHLALMGLAACLSRRRRRTAA
jgi:DNA-binding transcriptional regulator YiaG